jgi:hypothetical protein
MNVWAQFKKLLPSHALLTGEVIAVNMSEGTSVVRLRGGPVSPPYHPVLKVRGTGVEVGNNAFVRGGELVGPAPNLPVYDAEV